MEDIVLISDLHLGAGYDRARGAWDPAEVFFYDEAFAGFVDHLLARAQDEGRSWRLVILGDLFAFRLVAIPPPDRSAVLAGSEASAVWKLDQIARGHPHVFAALHRFLAAGFPVDVVSGNHDVELVRPGVQARLRELLGAGRGEAGQADVSFHPWIYYVPGVLYAEHGHQHQALEAFATVVTPYLPDDPDKIETTLAAFLFEYLLALDASVDPCPDHTTPPWRYFRLAVAHRPSSLVPVLSRHARFFVDLARHSAELSRSEARARQGGYRERTLPRHAAEMGLPTDVVLALDELTAASRRPPRLRLLEMAARWAARSLAPTARTALVVSALASPAWRWKLPGAVVAGGGLQERGHRQSRAGRRYLQRAAVSVHGLLRRAGLAVPYYVFAHDHRPQHIPLELGSDAPQYLNTGTWSCLAPSPSLGSPFRPTLVQVTFDPVTAKPLARLLLWDEVRRTTEPLQLQA